MKEKLDKKNSVIPLYIIKLGGSVITNKKENKLEFYPDIIERIADEIKTAQKEKQFSLIIVHGVGAYGHKLVKEYNLQDGVTTPIQYDACLTVHESILQLHHAIIKIFASKLTIQSFVPLEKITAKNKMISAITIDEIKTAIRQNKIPILFGDMVVDQELTAIALSGDDIACYLAKELDADILLFGSDVDGIYDRNKSIITEINQQNIPQYTRAIGESEHCDVTGGMKNKLEKVQQYSSTYVTHVFNLNKENTLYKNLIGEFNGTRIKV